MPTSLPTGAQPTSPNVGENTVSVVNTDANSLVATVRVGWRPVDAAVTSDGSGVYVANAGSGSVSVISTATNTVVATIPVGGTSQRTLAGRFLIIGSGLIQFMSPSL
jgi:YVTN family beta-propeller protein